MASIKKKEVFNFSNYEQYALMAMATENGWSFIPTPYGRTRTCIEHGL